MARGPCSVVREKHVWAGGKEVEKVKEVQEVEDRKADRAAVSFCGSWLTISGCPPPVFLEVFILKSLKSIVFIGLRKCSF